MGRAIYGDKMSRDRSQVYPNMKRYGLGEGIGCFEVCDDEIRLCLDLGDPYDRGIVIDPRLAPLFRLIAYRLDEISKYKV